MNKKRPTKKEKALKRAIKKLVLDEKDRQIVFDALVSFAASTSMTALVADADAMTFEKQGEKHRAKIRRNQSQVIEGVAKRALAIADSLRDTPRIPR